MSSDTKKRTHDEKGHYVKGHPGFNPVVYTEKFVIKELTAFIKEIKEDGLIYFGQLFENREYGRQRWHEWKTKYKDNAELMELYDRVNELLETRKVVGAMKKELDGRMVRAVLAMQNPEWIAKSKEEVTHKFDESVVSEEKNRILEELTGKEDK
jgi:hypothetical protein